MTDADSHRSPASDWGRRLHDSRHPRAPRPLPGRPSRLHRRAACRGAHRHESAPERGDRRAANGVDCRSRARAAPPCGALRCRDRLSRRAAGVDAHVVERRAGPHRLRALRPRHSVESQWDLLGALDIPAPDRSQFPVEMTVDPAAARAMDELLARAGVEPGDPVIVIHVSAGNPFRRWPIAAFAALVTALITRDRRRRVIVTSGPSDRQAAGRVITHARSLLTHEDRGHVTSCGECSLAELRALVERAALYIGGDSGPLHIAATSAIPVVGLYGPTLPVRSAPWRSPRFIAEVVEVPDLPCRPCHQRVCAPGDFRCLTWVKPEQVIDAAERALARAARM